MTTPNEDIQTNISAAAQLGSALRQAREQKNLSIGEVAERLKLPARQVEALENGDYEGMPEPVFVRGFLRSYGRFLDLNENTLAELLEQIHPTPKVNKVANKTSSAPSYTERRAEKSFPTWIIGVGAAVLIGGGVYAWQSKSSSENAKQEVQVSSEVNPASAPNLANANTIVQPMSASDSAMNASASAPAAAAVEGELVINARYRTMLTVRNAKGDVLINQIVPARSEHRFNSGAPFEVRIGYAIGSTATFGGEAINVDSKRTGKTAVFSAGENAANRVASAAQ